MNLSVVFLVAFRVVFLVAFAVVFLVALACFFSRVLVFLVAFDLLGFSRVFVFLVALRFFSRYVQAWGVQMEPGAFKWSP